MFRTAPLTLCLATALRAVRHWVGHMSFPASCWPWFRLGSAAALSILCPQVRTTRRRAMW